MATSKKTKSTAPIKETVITEDENKKVIEEEELNSVSLEEPETIVDQLKQVDKKYEGVTDADFYPEGAIVEIPDSLNLEKQEVIEIDPEKITDEVTKTETDKINLEKQAETTKTEQATKKKEEEKENIKANAETEKVEIGQIYDSYKISTESDLIKRGLARSSVAVLSLDNLEASRAKELSRVAENLTNSLNKVEGEILSLQQSLENSLVALDLELAVNINTQIEKKIKEMEEKQAEAIEFNNKVDELEAKYKASISDKKIEQAEYEEELAKKYEGYAQARKTEEKLTLAMNYYAQMDKTAALKEIISNTELARLLGDSFYDLYYYIMRK